MIYNKVVGGYSWDSWTQRGYNHSQDNKAKIFLGLPAAKKQSPLLMHMEYQLRLPDNDFAIAPSQKLIPFIIGDMAIKERILSGSVTYTGATYVDIEKSKEWQSIYVHHTILSTNRQMHQD